MDDPTKEGVNLDEVMRRQRTYDPATHGGEGEEDTPEFMTGHPSAEQPFSPPSDPRREAAPKEEGEPAPGEEDEGKETPKDDPPGGEPKEPPAGPESPETPASRFKDHAEAENGYRELQAKTTRVEQENAAMRKRLQALEESEKLASRQAARDKERKDLETFSEERFAKAFQDVNALDEDDPEHDAKASRIWAQANADVKLWEPEPADPPPQTPDARQEAPPAEEGQPDEEALKAEARRVWDEASALAEKGGIAKDDLDIFRGYAAEAPLKGQDGTPLTFKDQVAWAIGKTRGRLQAMRARILQESGAPMSRNGPGPTGKRPQEDTGRTTLNDAVESGRHRL